MRLPRSSSRYVYKRRTDEAPIVERLKQIAAKHIRFGYRRAHALLKRDGVICNPKRVYRLWRAEGLCVRRRIKRRGSLPKQERPHRAAQANDVWTVDFVHDQTISGRKIRMLTVTDEFTRQSLAITVGYSLRAKDVKSTLSPLFATHGVPKFLRSDNGSEFVALAVRGFLHQSGVATAYIDKGSPWQNGFAESFHSRFRDEFLNCEVFLSREEARIKTKVWCRWYNAERPHSSLGYMSPNEFAEKVQKEKATRENNVGTNINAGT